MAHAYQYKPLLLDAAEIRLLTILPGAYEDEIRCKLHHASLNEKLSYQALSYTWGDASQTRQIVLEGHPWSVTVNLEIALRHLRRQEEARVMWIDALCINQADLDERERQVPRMHQIYTSADAVVAWLGPAGDDGYAALAEIERLAMCVRTMGADVPIANISAEHFQSVGFDTRTADWASIWSLLQRPYWERVWVIQELATCPAEFEAFEDPDASTGRGIIMCGLKTVPKWMLDAACTMMLFISRSTGFMDGSELLEPVRTLGHKGLPQAVRLFLLTVPDGHSVDGQRDLANLLKMTGHFKATDPRDKIYALLNLARKQDALAVRVDYSKPFQLVAAGVMRHIIGTDNDLNSLPSNHCEATGLGPSWSGARFGTGQIEGAGWADGESRFQASGKISIEVSFLDQPPALIAKGVRVDDVELVFGPFVYADHAKWSQGQSALCELALKLAPAELERLWRTLVMDQDLTDLDNKVRPAPESIKHGFLVWVGKEEVPAAFLPGQEPQTRALQFVSSASHFLSNYEWNLWNRTFFKTKGGEMGIGPFQCQPGTVIAALFGAEYLAALKPRAEDDGGGFEYLGRVYVQGGMNGEFVREYEAGNHACAEYFRIY